MSSRQVFRFEDPFRPIYEYYAIACWSAAAAFAIVFRDFLPFGPCLFAAFLCLCGIFVLARGRVARRLWTIQSHLGGQRLAFMTRAQLRKVTKGHEDSIFLGYGFPWTQDEVQLAHMIARVDPSRLSPPDNAVMGQPWMHGIGMPREKPIFLSLDHTSGHILLVGTTRSGKTRMLDTIIAQAINRGEAVIIWDPKGDADLRDAARNACIDAGRASDFIFFHTAFPEISARIDALKNFSRPSELASRIAALIPSETGADPFTAHSMMVLNNLCEGLLMINVKPTLKLLKRFVDSGPEWLVVRVCKAYFDKKVPDWENMVAGYVAKAKGRSDREIAIAYQNFYMEVVQKSAPNTTLEALFADFTHDKTHQQKMTASLTPVLTMLTSGTIGDLLSPDATDTNDRRIITDFARIIRNGQVCYVGLDTLSDNMVGSAIGSLFLSDMTAVSGDRYNYGDTSSVETTGVAVTARELKAVTLVIDEAAEIVSDKMIQLLNKAGGSGLRLVVATQTFSDFAARVGSETKARMVLGNLNNKIVLRTIDGTTQEYIAENLPKTYVRHLEYSRATDANSDDILNFGSRVSESMKETEVPLVQPAVLGCLPSLEFFAQVSGGRVIKGRIPILKEKAA